MHRLLYQWLRQLEIAKPTFIADSAIVYTAYARGGWSGALALTKDCRSFEHYADIMQPEDKDAALLPRRIDGRWALIHRPVTASNTHFRAMFFLLSTKSIRRY